MQVWDWTGIYGAITIMQDRRGQGRERACACDALPEAVQVMFIIASGLRALDDIGIIDQWCVTAGRITTTVSYPKLDVTQTRRY